MKKEIERTETPDKKILLTVQIDNRLYLWDSTDTGGCVRVKKTTKPVLLTYPRAYLRQRSRIVKPQPIIK